MNLYDATIYSVPGIGVNFVESVELTNPDVLQNAKTKMKNRFRGFYPVVIDIEAGGFNPEKNPLLQIAAQLLSFDFNGNLYPYATLNLHVYPHPGDVAEEASLKFIGVDLNDPNRQAVSLKTAMDQLFKFVTKAQKLHNCGRSVIVAHNAFFDHNYIKQSMLKIKSKKEAFHPFVTFDTSTVGALLFGHTRLEMICQNLNIDYNKNLAHDALYDTQKTAEVFCYAINQIDTSTLNPITKYNL